MRSTSTTSTAARHTMQATASTRQVHAGRLRSSSPRYMAMQYRAWHLRNAYTRPYGQLYPSRWRYAALLARCPQA
jgi:hypothetical protein